MKSTYQRKPFPHQRGNGSRNLNDIIKKNTTRKKVECNGVVIKNEFKSCVKIEDTERMTVHLMDIEGEIVNFIATTGKGKTVVACIAWFTSRPILEALIEHAKRVLIVVNEENYATNPMFSRAVELYRRLPKFQEPLCVAFDHLKTCKLRLLDRSQYGDPHVASTYDAVRCWGNRSSSASAASLMHTKFMVFLDERPQQLSPKKKYQKIADYPRWAIYGSYNFTNNAKNNCEMLTIHESDTMARLLFDYFVEIFWNSKPLN